MIDASKVRVTGPLTRQAQGFWDELIGAGCTPRTARDHLYVLAHLSRWLEEKGPGAAELTPPVVEAFLRARRGAGYRRWLTARSLRPPLDYLRNVGAIPLAGPPVADTPVERLPGAYRRYLVLERRLAATTVRSHGEVAGRFLRALAVRGELDLDRLGPAEVTGFVVGESPRYSTGSMKALTTALRSLLRFLVVTDVVARDLPGAVPAIASWRMTAFPKDVEGRVVAELLGSCDRTTPVGLRDFAVLTLLVRLGLRAGEVAALRLDGLDWRAGELVVRGKGNRVDRLPLPHDVGAALAGYLCHGRGRSAGRAVFLRACAPAGGMSARSVVMVPRSASVRAGIPIVGAHRLRHTAATGMLARGASLSEVAQVLRHHSEPATAAYATVDRASLESVVRPWPGTGDERHSPGGRGLPRDPPCLWLRAAAGGPPAVGLRRPPRARRCDTNHRRHGAWLGDPTARRGPGLVGEAAHRRPRLRPLPVDPRSGQRGPASRPAAQQEPPGHALSVLTSPDRRPDGCSPPVASPLRAATFEAFIGLMAVTGLRTGEAMRLDRADVDLADGLLMVRNSKFGKSRHLPVHPTTTVALRRYARRRDELCSRPAAPSFFLSGAGTRLNHTNASRTFAGLLRATGIVAPPGARRPRLYDLRHSFAVATLVTWYEDDLDVPARLPALSTCMGHASPSATYWYLHAAPELMALAAHRPGRFLGEKP